MDGVGLGILRVLIAIISNVGRDERSIMSPEGSRCVGAAPEIRSDQV